MNIQTISIVVPTKGCVNKCPFCVSRMHDSPYENHWNSLQMEKRIKYAVMNGVNTCILTGTGEPLQNIRFLEALRNLFEKMKHPFPNVELQTTGVFLDQFEAKIAGKFKNGLANYNNINLLKDLGVNTISLSVSSVFDDALNMDTIGVSEKLRFRLASLISFLKEQGFNVRLSLNMLKDYDNYNPQQIIDKCKELGANQVTFRKMYSDDVISSETKWVKANKCKNETLESIKNYIEGHQWTNSDGYQDWIEEENGKGEFLYKLPFGGKVYSIEGMSTVIDNDCMSKETNDSLKYIVLRENGKLYCRWDDEGSLIF